jgi:hypothetical protein
LEIRKYNKSGPIIAKRCGEISPFTVSASDVYVRLKKIVKTDDESDNESDEEDADVVTKREPHLKFSHLYSKALLIF